MKKKLRNQIKKVYPWWDYRFLLKLMVLWLDYAPKSNKDKGNLPRSKHTSHQMRVVSNILKRIIADEYYKPCKVFTSRNKMTSAAKIFGSEDFEYLDLKYQNKHRQADIDFVFDVMKKQILSWWG